MSAEWVWVVLPPLGWGLWTWGGLNWRPARRYVYPAVLGIVLAVAGIAWWRCAWLAGCSSASFHLGYGDTVPWWRRALVGASYGLTLWPLGIIWWTPMATAVCFTTMMWLSRRYQAWTWKIVEGSTGLLHAGLATWLVTH